MNGMTDISSEEPARGALTTPADFGAICIDINQVEYSVGPDGPVIHVFGRDKEKNPRHLQVTGFRPYFYVPVQQADTIKKIPVTIQGLVSPVLYIEETKSKQLTIDLMLKRSGSENIGQLYKLPITELGAERDLEGVRKCVLDTVCKAQGRGCPPYIIGVGIGATKDQVTRLAKEQLMRSLEDTNRYEALSWLERGLLNEMNQLGIGPLGLGGRTTAIGVKIGLSHRHPASYFVDVSIACWADRRARLVWQVKS